tara:strand:- start:44 stop:361 length:318 start_codon:yes stop_codon:yes gene_type:complete
MLLIQKEQLKLSNAGCVNPKARSIGLKLKLMILFTILIFASGCSEFAILASGSSLAVSQNSYAKMYNAVDLGVVMTTKKGIKTHVYEKGKKYIYENTISLFGNKH